MGAYLTVPVTDKESSDGTSQRLSYGASSMQGWRRTQEDAHNCIIDFEKDTDLFAVYDGHGGAEVAKYCAEHLPDFILNHPEYVKGNVCKALEDAFLDFDATLTNPSVLSELKQIAGLSEASESDDNTEKLNQEASMPLEQVLAQYPAMQRKIPPHLQDFHNDNPKSPMLRAKKDGKAKISSSSMPDDTVEDHFVDDGNNNVEPFIEEEAGPCDSVRSILENRMMNGKEEKECDKQATCDSTTDDLNQPIKKANSSSVLPGTSEAEVVGSDDGKQSDSTAGSSSDNNVSSLCDMQIPESSTCDNSDCMPNTSSAKSSCSSAEGESSAIADSSSRRCIPIKINIDSSESSEEDDEDYGESESDSSDTEKEVDEEVDDSDDDDSEDEGVTEVCREEPGSDSGCTAVLAILKGDMLYVANAGDSRCVVSRQGQAIEMSVDHKPEDEIERIRVETAGGEVTMDGRVNGGLNLSRAIGDHAYKQNNELGPKQQMITAQPDVRILKIDTTKHDFMVLACDGIWNYMSSQEVIEFVRDRINNDGVKLTSISEELFDNCLAPSTDGDGTGCDNMTCIIIKFHDLQPITSTGKRSTMENEEPEVSGSSSKRLKGDTSADMS